MIRSQRATWSLLAGALLLGACNDALEVKNRDNPDVAAVLRLPRDVETLTGRLYQNVHTATIGNSTVNMYPQMLTLGLENVSSLANYGMGARGNIPRGFIDNARGNTVAAENLAPFQSLQTAARTSTTILEKFADTSFTLGSAAADARAEAFGYFGLGTALGNVALAYDSAAIPKPFDGQEIPPLQSAADVMVAALAALDTAQAIAASAAFTGAIPAAWLAASADVSKADFVRIIRSHKARFRAQMARTPAERAAVNWATVIADATNGITTDFTLQLTSSGGWDYQWIRSMYTTGAATWHQMTPYIIGMADTTPTRPFDAWLGTPRDARAQFLINTPDKRFPPGANRAAQLAASTSAAIAAGQYFRNRPEGEDVSGAAWANSPYDHYRWRSVFANNTTGPWVTLSKVENDMYAAEGYIRTGNLAAAAALINVSRARNNLSTIPAAIGRNDPVLDKAGGTAGCVPRVPDPAQNYIVTKCGDILEAAKWESRLESAYSGWAAWYLNGRGWGDLPEGSALNWPVPYQEADARAIPFKNTGGIGGTGGAAASTTYGYGSGSR